MVSLMQETTYAELIMILTEKQLELVMQAITISRNKQITKISDLKKALSDSGHSSDDIDAALAYWGSRQRKSEEVGCSDRRSSRKV